MTETGFPGRLLLVPELADDPEVRRILKRPGAVKRVLSLRATNGLADRGVVRIAANGRLLIDRERFVRWLYGWDQPPPEAR